MQSNRFHIFIWHLVLHNNFLILLNCIFASEYYGSKSAVLSIQLHHDHLYFTDILQAF